MPKIQNMSTSGSRNGCLMVPYKGLRRFPPKKAPKDLFLHFKEQKINMAETDFAAFEFFFSPLFP